MSNMISAMVRVTAWEYYKLECYVDLTDQFFSHQLLAHLYIPTRGWQYEWIASEPCDGEVRLLPRPNQD